MEEAVEDVASPIQSEPAEAQNEGEGEEVAVASDAKVEPDRGAAGTAPTERESEGPGEEPETAVERDGSTLGRETADEQTGDEAEAAASESKVEADANAAEADASSETAAPPGQPESEKFGAARAKANAEGLKAITEPQLSEWLESSGAAAAAGSDEDWPEAAEVAQAGYAASSSRAAPTAAVLERSRSAPSQAAAPSEVSPEDAASAPGCDLEVPAGGLRRFITDLAKQLEEEVRRRESEEAELERRAAEKKRLLEELDTQKKRSEALLVEQKDDDRTSTKIEKEHGELAEEHQRLRSKVACQETKLEQLREEAKARTGAGRDWARDGPEKDALVETKLRIAEAHDELAQMRQQLWMNREGLKKQLSDLQAENMRLRTGRSPLS